MSKCSVVERVSESVVYVAAATSAGLFTMSAEWFGAMAAFIIALASFGVRAWAAWRRDQREEIRLKMEINAKKSDSEDDD